LVAVTLDVILFKITNTYVLRDRPFLHLPNNLTDSAKAIWRDWPTYPSGHVRDLALYSTVLAGYAHELRWPFAILTLWVVYTRVYLGAHYPTDALAGWALGFLVGIAILLLIKPLRAHYLREREQRKQKKYSAPTI
jgi:undecaprenyl-diphosphatase